MTEWYLYHRNITINPEFYTQRKYLLKDEGEIKTFTGIKPLRALIASRPALLYEHTPDRNSGLHNKKWNIWR